MKKQFAKLSAVLVLITLAVTAQGQEKVWSLGPEIGVNFSKYGRDATDNDFKPGILGGLFATYSVNKAYAVTGKLLFSQKGTQYTIANTPVKVTTNYIEIPIIGRYFLVQEGAFRPNVFLGPSLGFLTGVSSKAGSGDYQKVPNYKDSYNTFDFGITGGIGFNYEVADDIRVLIDARYTYGLSDVTKSPSPNVNDPNINNMTIGLTAGVSFGIN